MPSYIFHETVPKYKGPAAFKVWNTNSKFIIQLQGSTGTDAYKHCW